jgi:hypothetical protein
VSKNTKELVEPRSQVVFHSILGQLCLTSVLPPMRLLDEVRGELGALPAGLTPSEVASRLFARISNGADPEWTPHIGHVLWGLPGIRVSVHTDIEYFITSVGWDGLLRPESVELPTERIYGWMKKKHRGAFAYSDVQVVLQNMVGNIVIIVDAKKDAVRHLLIDTVSNPELRRLSSSTSGAIVARLWRDSRIARSMSIDVEYPEGTPDTLWLRHLSGETYALSEGSNPDPSHWQIVGRRFLGSRVERHLRTTVASV